MPRLALVSLSIASLLGGGCVGALVIPPSRTDVGTIVVADGGAMTGGLRFSTGAHLASGLRRPDLPIDVGVGYVYERLAPGTEEGDGSMQGAAEPTEAHGGYVEVAHAVARSPHQRGWLGLRGEALARGVAASRRSVATAKVRLSWEFFGPAEGSRSSDTKCGVAFGFSYGLVGLGAFVESGAQWTEGEGTAFVATAGLSMRLPLAGGIGFDLCPRR